MASAGLREELSCAICLDIFSDPVSLGCGHIFCRDCIVRVMDCEQGSHVYTCPECRAEFQERPALHKNLKLRNIVERCFSNKSKQEGVIFCTYCIDFQTPSVKRCVQCEASLCENHLRAHSKSVEHVLTEPTASPVSIKCSVHKEPLKYYCHEDGVSICASCCLFGDHKGHQVGLLTEYCEKKKAELQNVLQKLVSIREETEERAMGLHAQVEKVQDKTTMTLASAAYLFMDIREQLDVLENKVLSEITRQQDEVLLQVSGRIRELDIKKSELSQQILHIEELSGVTDPITLLKECELINDDYSEDNDIMVTAADKLDDVLISVTLQNSLHQLVTILPKLKAKRGFYMQAASDTLLDPNTANNKIALSDDHKTASHLSAKDKQPRTPVKFIFCQVLSTASFNSGQHYLEVEVSNTGYWVVGMAYPSIKKTGKESLIGCNDRSWGLSLVHTKLSALHNSECISVDMETPLQALGIYLDYEVGRLSFYQLSDQIRHLHTFSATFTEPLYSAIYVCGNSWVKIR